jgi:hypothetical protein
VGAGAVALAGEAAGAVALAGAADGAAALAGAEAGAAEDGAGACLSVPGSVSQPGIPAMAIPDIVPATILAITGRAITARVAAADRAHSSGGPGQPGLS